MHGDVLRRQALFDNALHLVFRDRGERRVVAVEERKPDVFVAHKERLARVCGVALAEAEQTLVRTLARRDLFKLKPEVFALGALKFNLPLFAALFTHRERQLRLAAREETKVEIVAHRAPVDLDDAVARSKLQLGCETRGLHVCAQHAAPPNLCHRRFYCKLVHRKTSLKAKPVRLKFGLINNRTVSPIRAPDSTRAALSAQQEETTKSDKTTRRSLMPVRVVLSDFVVQLSCVCCYLLDARVAVELVPPSSSSIGVYSRFWSVATAS